MWLFYCLAGLVLLQSALSLRGGVRYFTGRAAADNPHAQAEQQPGFGLVTLVPGQDMRLNVVNTATVQPNLPPNP